MPAGEGCIGSSTRTTTTTNLTMTKEATQRRRKRQGKGRGGGGEGALPAEKGGVLLDGRLALPPLAIMTINNGGALN